MKKKLLILLIFFFTISMQYSYPDSSDYNLMLNPNNNKYTTILSGLIKKTEFLELEEKEINNVSYLKRFYLDILKEKSEEYNSNEIEIMEIVRDKGRNLRDARRLVRKNAELKLQLGYTFIESLEYIKTNLGTENYNKLMHSSEIDLFKVDEFDPVDSGSDEDNIGIDFESTGIEEEAGSNR